MMKVCVCLAALIILFLGEEIGAKPKKQKGLCFARYSSKHGCRTIKIIKGVRKSTFEDCCRTGGLGWSLKSKDRMNCTSCPVVPKPKNQKGFCFERYSLKSGCRKYTLVNGEKKSTIEECCRSGGLGWALKKKKKWRKCVSCDTVDTSFWGEWGQWTPCSATCGQGFHRRQRKCMSLKGKPNCLGSNKHSKRCDNLPPCPVDGGWTDWSPWGPCSVTCKIGSKIRQRECANPKPQHGGKECEGQLEDWAQCEIQKHCPIDGGWGEWGQWSTCTKTCDLGTKTRSRKCDNPLPKYGGKPCTVKDGTGLDYCLEERCHPGKSPCDDRIEECASGSGSNWETNSGSGSGEGISGSGFSSGFGSASGEGLDGGSGKRIHRRLHKKKLKPLDDED